MDRWIDDFKPKQRKMKRTLKKIFEHPETEVKRYRNKPRGLRNEAVFAVPKMSY